MISTASRVRCDIDFDKSGRQASYLRAPQSRNTSGWGVVEIPIYVFKNGTGPTLLLTGGVHGDEYEGQSAGFMHFIDDLDRPPERVRSEQRRQKGRSTHRHRAPRGV